MSHFSVRLSMQTRSHSLDCTAVTILSSRNGRSVDVDLELDENDLVVGRYFHYRTLLAEGLIDMV